MTRVTRILRDLCDLGWGEGSSRLLGLAAGAIIARALGPSDYGTLNLAATWLTYALLAVVFGSSDVGITMLSSLQGNEKAGLTRSLLTFRLLVALVAYPVYVAFVAWILNRQDSAAIGVILGVWVFSQAAATDWWLSSERRFRAIAKANVLSGVAYLGATIASAAAGAGVIGMAVASVTKPVVQTAIQGVSGGWKSAWAAVRGYPEIAEVIRKRMIPLGITSIVTQVYFSADVLIVALTASRLEIGFYSAAVRVVALGLSLRIVFGSVIYPRVAVAATRANEADLSMLSSANTWALSLGLLVGLAGSAASGPIVLVLYGDSYSESILPLAIAWWVVGLDVSGMCLPNILATRRPRSYLGAVSVAAGYSVVANLLVVPVWGIVGASVVYVTGGVILYALLLRAAARALGTSALRPSWPQLAFAGGVCGLLVLVLLVDGYGLPSVIVAVACLGLAIGLRRRDVGQVWRLASGRHVAA